jgi:hypothetical protein
MNVPRSIPCGLSVFFLFALVTVQAADLESLAQGSVVEAGGRRIVLQRLDSLPFVESEYTRRFNFDSATNPKLRELREQYRLDQVIADGKDEFDQQVRLMNWTHHQFKKFGKPSAHPQGALEILQGINEGQTFFCAHYTTVLVSAAASLGWVDRPLALRRHQGVAAQGGSTEHSVTEIWSNQYRKWVMLDPTSNMYLEKDGLPLNAVEIRQEWFYRDGKDLTFVIGSGRDRYKRADLPVLLAQFSGFGDLAVNPDELDKYGFIGFIPNTNLMDAGEDYAQMFIVKDALCDGTRWHQRLNPANPSVDPYFPIGQAALSLKAAGPGPELRVTVRTFTPNFARFEIQLDGGAWKAQPAPFTWTLHPGPNQLAVVSVNRFGVRGPVSTATAALE